MVSFNEYVTFFWFLNQMTKNKFELFKNNRITLQEFIKAANQAIKSFPIKGISAKINPKHLEVFMSLLDSDGKIVLIR
jgi:hypothetical protein